MREYCASPTIHMHEERLFVMDSGGLSRITVVIVAVVDFVVLYYGYRAIRFIARYKTEVERAYYWK